MRGRQANGAEGTCIQWTKIAAPTTKCSTSKRARRADSTAGSQGQPLAAQGDIGGSNRKSRGRWRYAPADNTWSAFIEIMPFTMEPCEFMERLRGVQGVTNVALTSKGSKESQGNPDSSPDDPTRGHRQPQCFEVWYNKYPNNPVEFELTRST